MSPAVSCPTTTTTVPSKGKTTMKSGLSALEAWGRKITNGYPGVHINDLSASWRDGLGFCAIIHHYRPDLIDFSQLSKDDIEYNNQLAFDIAERHLNIPQLLEVEDMVRHHQPDKRSIALYLSEFYNHFEAKRKLRPQQQTPGAATTTNGTANNTATPNNSSQG